jgi:RIO kinase 1
MRIPESLATLAEYGVIEQVVRPLMSGKEAQVYLVISGGEERVAKIYKEAAHRSFKNRAEYTEGRTVRSSRDQRAISKRTTHGRAQDEAEWRSHEVSMIYRLQAAGVRVPVAYNFIDGVLVMELIKDADGNPAPRLAELDVGAEAAAKIYQQLLREVVRMLCAGVVHGDFSDFNVLMAADGPVVIDFPQAVDAAHNQNARKLLLRDVDNLHDFLARFVRDAQRLPFAEEMWELYQSNSLTPDTPLTGRYRGSNRRADTASVLSLIDDANRDERRRRDLLGLKGGPQTPPAQTPQRPPAPQHVRPATEDRNSQPQNRNPQPQNRNPQPQNRNPQPQNRNPQPQSRNPQPQGRNPQPQGRNPQPQGGGRGPHGR